MALAPAEIAPVVQRHWLGETARRHPTVMIGVMLLLAMAAMALLAPYLGTVDPLAVAPVKRLRPPSELYWFGTDSYGRDVYSRTLYGARVSLTVGLSVAMFGTALGLAIGLVTGFVRRLELVVVRVMDALMSASPSRWCQGWHGWCGASCFRSASSLSSKRRWRRAPASGAHCSATSSPTRSRRWWCRLLTSAPRR